MTPPPIRLSGAVMTHPKRIDAARAVADGLPELGLQVVVDPEPEGPPAALRAARLAWAAVDPGATHHLVIQDDAVPSADFTRRLNSLIAAQPDAAVSLFTEWGSRTSHVIRIAAMLGYTMAPVVDDYIPAVALVLPAEVARGFEEYVQAKVDEGAPDDVALLDYLSDLGIRTVIPVANLVDHRDDISLVGNNVMGNRSAACLPPPDAVPDGPHSLLTAPATVPYYDFWGQYSDACIPDESSVDGRVRSSARVWLRERGVTYQDMMVLLEEALDRHPQREFLVDRLSEISLSELWIVAYLLGVITAEHARAVGRTPDFTGPLTKAALATFGPGAVRRVVPARWLPAVGSLLEPLILDGVRAGAARETSRASG
ncbi:hypothetical protein ACFORH_35185 [Amycolatopsis roodepoortensis]|uniref:Glycosyltransferase n=1 Tax=Amycolatopsis roodepoortensis TaxID=700274 RepID=A0ABR9L1A1_9PSEU|nr:hypothetical protein [Amycolatopsis roodepoortensis]MBE1574373.1 hypothetical protein [Amycolatopsis roodepoortensis]